MASAIPNAEPYESDGSAIAKRLSLPNPIAAIISPRIDEFCEALRRWPTGKGLTGLAGNPRIAQRGDGGRSSLGYRWGL